jgi:hypothetical protein
MSLAVPSRPVLSLLLVTSGLSAGLAGLLVLRSFGPGLRVGRLLSISPVVPIDEAIAIAAAGEDRYVGIEGRIDATEEFEDDAHRPLVFRRRRLEARSRGRWVTLEDAIERVPFSVDAGAVSVAVDGDALGPGLVVLPRESTGTAAEIPGRLPPGMSPTTPVRLRIEQVSSVEHATVLGRPWTGPDGTTRMTAGLGRPLVLTTLERDEAMRILAGGRRGRARAAAALLAAAPVLVAAGLLTALAGRVV